MNMHSSRDALIEGAQSIPGHDLLVSALQLMMSALTIIDAAAVPSPVGAHLDHAMQMLAEYLVAQPPEAGSAA